MKNILVPFDFGKPATEGFKYAVALASRQKGTVVLVHTILLAFPDESMLSNSGPLPSVGSLFELLKKDSEARFEKILRRYDDAKCRIDYVVLPGGDSGILRKLVRSRSIDLIVMGADKSDDTVGKIDHWTVRRLLVNTPVPVLVVKKGMKAPEVRRILFPSTMEGNETHGIKLLKKLQKIFKAQIDVLLVNTPDHFIIQDVADERMRKFMIRYKLRNCKFHFYNHRSEIDGISHFARNNEIDLVVISTHARRGLSYLLHGSVAMDVVSDFEVPVMTTTLG